jgi:hypothetical protein
VAYQLNKALAREAEDDELEMEIAAELANYAEFVERLHPIRFQWALFH